MSEEELQEMKEELLRVIQMLDDVNKKLDWLEKRHTLAIDTYPKPPFIVTC